MRPITPPTTTMESKIMTMFWNRLKFDDQNRICSNMKIAQQIAATSVTTIGMNGLSSLVVITTHFVL
jgi:hypothetical protein